jgi:iron(III) transport system substrate-binding protein
MRRHIRTWCGVAGLVLAVALTACGGDDGGATSAAADTAKTSGASPEAQKYLDDLYAKAQAAKQSTVTIYTPYTNLEGLYTAFNEQFPEIKISQGQAIFGAALANRLKAEDSSKNHRGDIVLSGITDYVANKQYLAPLDPPTAEGLPAEQINADKTWHVPFRSLYGLSYNTKLVPDGNLPKDLDAALAGQWKSKPTLPLLTGFGAADMSLATLWYNKRLPDGQELDRLLQRLKDATVQNPSAVASIDQVAQGQTPFVLWGPSQNAADVAKRGAPVKTMELGDLTVLHGPGIALLKNAPAPEAGELFAAWMFTPAAQKVIADTTFNRGTMPGAPKPAGLPPLDGYDLKSLPIDEAASILQKFRQHTERIFPG